MDFGKDDFPVFQGKTFFIRTSQTVTVKYFYIPLSQNKKVNLDYCVLRYAWVLFCLKEALVVP